MNVALFLEIKNEYTEHLTDTLTPYIYEGLSSIYKEAVKAAEESKRPEKTLLIFQRLLQYVSDWSQIKIEEETNRIKKDSNTAEYLDKLVKAIIKSNIILLSYSNTVSNNIAQTFYNNLTTPTFIHRCYTECAKDAHNNPYLFYHDINPMDLKRNQIIVQQHIQSGITRAVRKILPISMILEEYLNNSVNIIYEPAKEQLGLPCNQANPADPMAQADIFGKQPPTMQPKLPSDKNNDAKKEKEILQRIKSDTKTDKDRIQDIMNMDKILSNIQPTKPAELSARSSASRKVLSSITKQRATLPVVAPYLAEDDDNDIVNVHLNRSDEKILNIDFDKEQTVDANSKKTVTTTTLSDNPGTKNMNAKRMYVETSERMDPNKIKLIEVYGSHPGTLRKK